MIPCFIEIPLFNANSVDPNQTPRSAASDLGLHCLPMSILWDDRHKWGNTTTAYNNGNNADININDSNSNNNFSFDYNSNNIARRVPFAGAPGIPCTTVFEVSRAHPGVLVV